MALTYSNYLKLDLLLALQEPRSSPPEHDETLFIVVHQVYELWFKLLIHELDQAGDQFSANDLFGAIATFKRLRTVMKTLVGQLDILETMTPMSFLTFRDRLESASGFQSWQFREFEFVLGYKRPELLQLHGDEPEVLARLERRVNQPSLVHHWYRFLGQRGMTIPADLTARDVRLPTIPHDVL